MAIRIAIFIILTSCLLCSAGTARTSQSAAYAERVGYVHRRSVKDATNALSCTNYYPIRLASTIDSKSVSWTNGLRKARMLNDSALRFDVLNPHPFSRMGAIRMKAREMHRKGENTDALWNRYWELYYKQLKDSE